MATTPVYADEPIEGNLVLGKTTILYGADTNKPPKSFDLTTTASGVDPTAATYAAARLVAGSTTGDRLVVLGRTTKSDGGQGLFTWVAGGTTTVDEGYVLQATGGTWQRIDPSPTVGETLLNAVWFNIKPTNADTVNDTGFAKLKAQMQTSSTTLWHVYFPPGTYLYTNNRWLFAVQKVIIDTYDCTFQCTSADANSGNGLPLMTNDAFDDSGDTPWPHVTYANGYLFNTAAAGATTITTTTAADAGNFTPGMRVLLHGYDQQGSGYPPDMRYFEPRIVLTAVAGTGVITFTEPLQFAYDSRWWDTANYASSGKAFGAPRILSLERANYKRAKLLWFKGGTWLPSSTNAAFATLSCPADLLICEDVTAQLSASNSDRVIYNRVTGVSSALAGPSEIDKLIGTMVIQDSSFNGLAGNQGLTGAVGCFDLSIYRSRLIGGLQLSPRNLLVDDCDIGPLGAETFGVAVNGGFPVTSLCVRNTRVFNTGGLLGGVSPGVLNGISFTVGSVSGTNIQLTWNGTSQALAYNIDYGMTLSKSDGSKTGIITGIYLTGGNTLVITGTWAAPVGGETWQASSYCINQTDGGGNSIVGTQVPFWRYPNQLSYPLDPVFSGAGSAGGPTIKGQLNFPGVAGTYLQNTASGLQFTEASTNIALLTGGVFFMQGQFWAKDIYGATSNNLIMSQTAPTISSGFGAGASVTQKNGTTSFSINVGTGGAASSGVIGLPTAAHAWAGSVADVTTPTGNHTVITASTTNSVTVTNYSRTTGVATAWPASDILQLSLFAN